MTIDGRTRDLEMGALAAFSGETDVAVEPPGGPTRNLNLMTRRTVCEGSVDVRSVNGALPLGGAHGPVALVVLSGTARLRDGRVLRPLQVLVPGSDEDEVSCRDALIAAVRVDLRPGA